MTNDPHIRLIGTLIGMVLFIGGAFSFSTTAGIMAVGFSLMWLFSNLTKEENDLSPPR
jgi:hypothetical protein